MVVRADHVTDVAPEVINVGEPAERDDVQPTARVVTATAQHDAVN